MGISNVTSVHTEELTVSGDVSGEEARVTRVRFTRQDFRPTHIQVRLDRKNGGPWKLSVVRVTGPKVKTDGSDSVITKTNTYYRFDSGDDVPEWVLEFINDNMPSPGEGMGWTGAPR